MNTFISNTIVIIMILLDHNNKVKLVLKDKEHITSMFNITVKIPFYITVLQFKP